MHSQPAKGTKLITSLVKTEIDMERHLQRLHLREQGRASHLTETQTQLEELSWSRIVRRQSVPQTAFMLQARANVLMDGPRIARAYGILQPSCPLCGQQPWTVKHVLANCKYVFESEAVSGGDENRVTWRHNNVLLEIYLTLQESAVNWNRRPLLAGLDRLAR